MLNLLRTSIWAHRYLESSQGIFSFLSFSFEMNDIHAMTQRGSIPSREKTRSGMIRSTCKQDGLRKPISPASLDCLDYL